MAQESEKNKGGRPPKPINEKKVHVSSYVAPSTWALLLEIAEREGLDQSGVVRAACEQYVSTRSPILPKHITAMAAMANTEKRV